MRVAEGQASDGNLFILSLDGHSFGKQYRYWVNKYNTN